jgi:hypothetical protein
MSELDFVYAGGHVLEHPSGMPAVAPAAYRERIVWASDYPHPDA